MPEFNKKYIPTQVEQEIAQLRAEEEFWKHGKRALTIGSLPLPTAGNLHLGHAQHMLLVDALARYYHLRGQASYMWPSRYYGSFLTNEKIQTSLKKIGTSKDKITKAQFASLIGTQARKQKIFSTIQLQKLGIPLDIQHSQVSYGIHFSRFLRKFFYQLVQDDIIYEAEDIVYRNTKYQTSLGKDEVSFEKQTGKKYTLKYFISTKNNSINVITTSPETIFGDVALAVHPDNKRYHALVGQKAIIPIINSTIPIIADERIDMFANNGIMRITPAHDLFSLQIAKDHKLPVDHFAIDQDGCFTKHAGDFKGKKVDEFMENILQNLADIDNMVSVESCEYDVPICKKTGEKLQIMCLVQWFLNVDQAREKLQHLLDQNNIHVHPVRYLEQLKLNLATINKRCISKNYHFGQNLPIWISEKKGMIYVLDEDDVIQSYKKDKHKQKLKVMLSIIIFNLIADGRLNSTFEMEDLITMLLAPSPEEEMTVLETYIDILETDVALYKPQLKELKEILYFASKEKAANIEKFAESFIKILETSFAIENVANHRYQFYVDKLIQRDSGLRQEKSKFDISFVNAMMFLYGLGREKKNFTPSSTLMVAGEHSLLDVDKILLLSLQFKTSLCFDTLFINSTVCDAKQKKMGSLCQNNIDLAWSLKTFGADVTRLYLMSQTQDSLSFSQEYLASYDDSIQKFWNACRYVSLAAEELYGKKKINLPAIEKELEKHMDDLHDFDLWIINKIRELYQEVDQCLQSNMVREFGLRLLSIVKDDFCNKYLEISKHNKSALKEKVMIYIISKFLKLFWIYIPFVSEKLWILMGFSGYLSQQTLDKDFLKEVSKNYKIQLFMDIIDKFLELKTIAGGKKHTLIDVFLKANPDFLRFTKSHEQVVKKIINIQKFDYLNVNESHPQTYTTEDIIDMTIGIKPAQEIRIVEKLKGSPELKKELNVMKEYMQYLRNTVSSMISNKSPEEDIDKKKREINKVKKDILELEYEISKLQKK